MTDRRVFLKGLAAILSAPFTAVIVPAEVLAPTLSLYGRHTPPPHTSQHVAEGHLQTVHGGVDGPVACTEGDLWYDITGQEYYRFNGNLWEKIDEPAFV